MKPDKKKRLKTQSSLPLLFFLSPNHGRECERHQNQSTEGCSTLQGLGIESLGPSRFSSGREEANNRKPPDKESLEDDPCSGWKRYFATIEMTTKLHGGLGCSPTESVRNC